MFTLYPAIDLRNGAVVRLKQGDPNQQTHYGDDPAAVARAWAAEGAQWLHVVNLDGSFGNAAAAAAANRAALASIAQATSLPIQFGGGIRTMDDARAAFDAGVARVIVGTALIENPALVGEILAGYGPERLVVGLDSKDGMIVTRGWQHATALSAITAGEQLRAQGVIHALYTEVGRDGMLGGAAAELTAALAQCTGLNVIASGGVGSLQDIEELRLYAPHGVGGVVVGKALYEKRFTLRAALRQAGGQAAGAGSATGSGVAAGNSAGQAEAAS